MINHSTCKQVTTDTNFAEWLEALYGWFCYNGLALSLHKSNGFILGTTQHGRYLPIISTVNVTAAIVTIFSHVNLLDVTLDSGLSSDLH